MKTLFPLCLMLLLCIKGNAQPPAQFLTGGEIYYTYQGMLNGEHVYRVTIQCYAKCGNAPHERSLSVSIFDRLTNVRVKRVKASLNSTSTINLPADSLNICLVNPPSLCNVVAFYSFDVSLPPSANGYLLSCSPGYRAEYITNFQEQGYVRATYTAEIPAGNAAVNSTFRITGDDLVMSCANSRFSYSFGTIDYDGDELRYYLCGAYQAGLNVDHYIDTAAPPPFQSVIYAPNFSSSVPLGATVMVDEQSGVMRGVAPAAGNYMVTICVGEYRNGVLIATQRKEVQINIMPCAVTAASLLPEYLLCTDSRTLQLSNLSTPFRIESWHWQISSSNGTILYTQTTPAISYTFTDTGIYKIKLVINRGLECADSTTSIAKVYPGLNTGFSFSGTCINNPTSFTNTTTATYGQLNYWKWNFGDNLVGNAAFGIADVTTNFNPVYQYQSSGSKQVQLIVGTTMGCRDTLRRTINISGKPQMSMPFRDTLICRSDTVQLLAYAPAGGNFSWSPQMDMVNGNTPRPKVAPALTTVYYVLLDDNGCRNRDSVQVRVTDKVLLQAMNDTTICQGDTIQLHVVSDGFTYAWTNTTPSNAALPNPTVVTNTTTNYQVTAFIGKGCKATDSVGVTTVPYPLVNAGRDTMICNQTAAQLMGSTNGSSFTWSPAITLTQPGILNPVAHPDQTTFYVLRAYDSRGCPKAAFDTVVVTVLPPLQPFAGRDTTVVVGQPLQLSAGGGSVYEWSPATALSAGNIRNPIAIYNAPTDAIRYKVRISNEAGCADSAYMSVKVYASRPVVFVPTAFTPNGDGRNDEVRPVAAGMVRVEYFSIYNRWGQLVFSTQSSGQGWDGTMGGKMQNTGVFTWAVKAVDYNGRPYFQKGFVTLIR